MRDHEKSTDTEMRLEDSQLIEEFSLNEGHFYRYVDAIKEQPLNSVEVSCSLLSAPCRLLSSPSCLTPIANTL